MKYLTSKNIKGSFVNFFLGGGAEIFFRYFGGDPKKNGNFQIFTHPPPLINNERSLTVVITKRLQDVVLI